MAAARLCGMPLADFLRMNVWDCIAWGIAAFSGVRALLRGDPEKRIRDMVESDELPIEPPKRWRGHGRR